MQNTVYCINDSFSRNTFLFLVILFFGCVKTDKGKLEGNPITKVTTQKINSNLAEFEVHAITTTSQGICCDLQ